MSSFGSRRKARVIKVDDEGEGQADAPATDPKPTFASRAGRKPFRQSGLRKTLDNNDDDTPKQDDDDDEDSGPAVVRPNVARSASSKKRPPTKSKISFHDDDADEAETGVTRPPPKKTPLGKRAVEKSAASRLPMRSFRNEDDDDRPKYSKAYLEELQSSTPNTPAATGGDAMELDESELDGALVVEDERAVAAAAPAPATQVLSEAEIREKKERRARLAQEQGFLSVEDDNEEGDEGSRIKPDDDNVAEGFEEYVEDGGLSLGKRAERERRRRDRAQMAELITAAEGDPADESSDSDDAERRIAYEAAQTRAGLANSRRRDGKRDGSGKNGQDVKVPTRIAPIPTLAECVERLTASLGGMEARLREGEARVQALRDDKDAIAVRQKEVQTLLDETGSKYQAAMAQGKVNSSDPAAAGATGTTTTPASGTASAEMIGARGLESLGATPGQERDEGE